MPKSKEFVAESDSGSGDDVVRALILILLDTEILEHE